MLDEILTSRIVHILIKTSKKICTIPTSMSYGMLEKQETEWNVGCH